MIENEDTNKEEEIEDLTTEEEIKDFTDSINIDGAFNYPTINSPTITGGAKLNLGSGNKCFKFQADKGIWLGHTDYASAPFRVDMDGAIAGSSFSLTSISGDLDDIGDGTDYSKVLTTDITAGHILLSATTGDLGDISDGGGYGKIASTSISAGKIILTSGTGVNGSLPVGNSDAKCTDADADGTQAALTAGANIDNAKANGTTLISGGYINTGIITATNITAGTLTGITIQTASSGERLRMQGSPANEYQFLDDDTKVGHLKIDDDGAGGYYAELYIDNLGAALKVGSTIGAAELIYFSAPFFSGSGRAATGQVTMQGSGVLAGMTWAGGATATWSFNLGDNLAKISSNIVPSATYDLGTTGDTWNKLWVDEINLNGTAKTAWPTAGVTSHGDLTGVTTSQHHVKYTDSNARSAVVNTALGGSLYPSSTSYNLGSSSYYWGDFYFHAGGEIYVGSTAHYLRLNQRDYLTHDAVGFDNLGDTLPEGDGIWDLGNASHEFNAVYSNNYPASPLKVSESGIETFKKIKGVRKSRGKYTLETEDLPDEFKIKDKEGNYHTELKRTIGLTVQALKELIEEVEIIKQKVV